MFSTCWGDCVVRTSDPLLPCVHFYLQLNHSNVVRIEQFFDGKVYCYLVMELITGGELFARLVEKVMPRSPALYDSNAFNMFVLCRRGSVKRQRSSFLRL